MRQLLLLLLILSAEVLYSQDAASAKEQILRFGEAHRDLNRQGMYVLGSWALLNIAAGSALSFTAKGAAKEFHIFNAAWNTVNLGIAGFSLYASGPVPGNPTEILADYYNLQSFFLLNAGLDAAYIMTGYYLKERANRSTEHKDRLTGYGNSLLLQGGFLLLFDAAMYILHRNNAETMLVPVLQKTLNGASLTLIIPF
ncbi:MAG: hypothetical protein L6Q47_06950 [Ignavibacteriaceae bacterium]|nr:hypothetical protein [Ignavibacteriaceae bacterium]